MNLLMTGSTGYIGSNLKTGLGPEVSFFELSRKKGFDFTTDSWSDEIPEKDYDAIIHLAQSRNYRQGIQAADDLYKVNLESTFKLLEWGKQHDIDKFIFASTGNVYEPKERLLIETDRCEADSMYSATKLSSEHLCKQYSVFFEVIILRIFTVFGPGQKDMLIPNIFDRVINEKEITLSGEEGIFLTPIYIEDCIRILRKLLEIGLDRSYEIYNVAGDQMISLKDIVLKMAKIVNKKPRIIKNNDETVKWLGGDNEKLKQISKLEFSLQESLKRFCMDTMDERKLRDDE